MTRCLRAVRTFYGLVYAELFVTAAILWGLVGTDLWSGVGDFAAPAAIVAVAVTAIALSAGLARRPVVSASERWKRQGADGLVEEELGHLGRIRDRLEGTDRWGGGLAAGHLDSWIAFSVLLSPSIMGPPFLWTLFVWAIFNGRVNLVGVGFVTVGTVTPFLLFWWIWRDLRWI